jgi:peptide/nickel transport system ATP-binding protein
MTALNPVMTCGAQLDEVLGAHTDFDAQKRRTLITRMLGEVALADPQRMLESYPHQLSGGQRQRVMIAMALLLDPALLIADEPTSALDVSVKAQILNLLDDLRMQLGLGMVFISHDIHAVRHLSDRIAVMYLGHVVEEGAAARVADNPRHPYTVALLSAVPTTAGRDGDRIVLEGPVPSPRNPPSGCPFRTRCWRAQDDCATAFPPAIADEDRAAWCLHPVTPVTRTCED